MVHVSLIPHVGVAELVNVCHVFFLLFGVNVVVTLTMAEMRSTSEHKTPYEKGDDNLSTQNMNNDCAHLPQPMNITKAEKKNNHFRMEIKCKKGLYIHSHDDDNRKIEYV